MPSLDKQLPERLDEGTLPYAGYARDAYSNRTTTVRQCRCYECVSLLSMSGLCAFYLRDGLRQCHPVTLTQGGEPRLHRADRLYLSLAQAGVDAGGLGYSFFLAAVRHELELSDRRSVSIGRVGCSNSKTDHIAHSVGTSMVSARALRASFIPTKPARVSRSSLLANKPTSSPEKSSL